jgi:hypothetical protein
MKLLKIKENHFIIVSDESIKEGDNILDNVNRIWLNIESCFLKPMLEAINSNNVEYMPKGKITHSTEPLEGVLPLDLSEVKELIGESVWSLGNRLKITSKYEMDEGEGFISYEGIVIEQSKGLALKCDDGKIFNCQGTYYFGSILNQKVELLKELNKEKKYTEEDLRLAYLTSFNLGKRGGKIDLTNYIKSLQLPTEWNIKINNGKIELV